MRSIGLYLLLLMGCLSTASATPNNRELGTLSIYEAINKAGYQRMLTQRMAASYLAIVADIRSDRYQQQLSGCVRIFERNLEDLQENISSAAIQDKLKQIGALWQVYKKAYKEAYTLENAVLVFRSNDQLLQTCEEVVNLLQKLDETHFKKTSQIPMAGLLTFSTLIDKAGKQRMLTQRMLLFTLAKHLNLDSEERIEEGFANALGVFEGTNGLMETFQGNTLQINTELSIVKNKWQEVEAQLLAVLVSDHPDAGEKETLKNALEKSERVLFTLDEIVFLYEKKAKKEK